MIITLCGSARFEPWFHIWNEVLTLSGHTVFSLACFPSQKGKKTWYSQEEKSQLDKAHLRKIDASDAILILNVFAYLGDSTLNEIAYARKLKKKLYALESWGKGNGIGSNHYPSVRRAATKYNVCIGSPIDTMSPTFKYPYDLLPENPFRGVLVDKLTKFRKENQGLAE